MSDQRDGGISWTDETWNPVRGCSRVSPGCVNCYAETMAARFSGPGMPYEGLARRTESGDARWTGEVRLVPEHLADPLRWKRPRRVFVNSMSDLFHEKLSNEDIAAVFGVMAAAPHTFQVLTKRPKRMREWFEWAASHAVNIVGGDGEVRFCIGLADRHVERAFHVEYPRWPLPNVWLGVSVEDQQRADERIPHLLETPAAVRFLSCEPLLGPLDLAPWLSRWRCKGCGRAYSGPVASCQNSACIFQGLGSNVEHLPSVGWLIVGGESGPSARAMDLVWARSLVTQCDDTATACFVKQLGSRPHNSSHWDIWDDRGYVGFGATDQVAAEEIARRYPGGRVGPGRVKLKDRQGAVPGEWPADLQVQDWP